MTRGARVSVVADLAESAPAGDQAAESSSEARWTAS
jgi:hypothetical protein